LNSQINVCAENESQELIEQINNNVVSAIDPQNDVILEEKIFMLPIEEPFDLKFTEIYSKNIENVYDEINSNEGISELDHLKLNIETSVGESTPSDPGYGVPLPLVEVGVSRFDEQTEVNVVDLVIQDDVEKMPFMLPIDELIELAFQEKHLQNFELSVSYFSQALAQDP